MGLCMNSAVSPEIILPPSCDIYAEMRSIGMWGHFERISRDQVEAVEFGHHEVGDDKIDAVAIK